MRYLCILALALSFIVGPGPRSTAAPRDGSRMPPAPQDLYCLQGRTWGYPGNCQFSTYAQCMTSASGTNAYCGINPIYAFERHGRLQR